MQQFIGKLARMYPLLIVMGFMMVAIAFVVGYFNSQAVASYFSQPKVLRETTLLAERAAIVSTDLWLPYFKFLGIGLILSGIVMALRVIIDNLRGAGAEVLENLPAKIRPAPPSPPWYGPMMPVVMMFGLLIFIVALIVALGSAADARALFANPIPVIDAAGAGTALLATLEGIKATSAWLVPLKFFGNATEFLAITMGLATIIHILSQQTEMIAQGIDIGRKSAKAARREDERAPAYADN
ncbi:MAG: hypothetical protein ACC647_03850 [Anaerolineales bacterium]